MTKSERKSIKMIVIKKKSVAMSGDIKPLSLFFGQFIRYTGIFHQKLTSMILKYESLKRTKA